MKDSGLYKLTIFLPQEVSITIGKLGNINFPKGYYIYTGSATNGLQARVSRHFSKKKKRHWHIDYLLFHARIVNVELFYEPGMSECELNSKSKKEFASSIVKGFGSSDCNCKSHLVYLL